MANQHNRIFIVDDDMATRESLTEILSLKGYTAESAGTAEKAIEKIKDWPVDLFLIDLRMTGMEGIELLKKLDKDYDPTNRWDAFRMLEEAYSNDLLVTGVIYVNPDLPTLHDKFNLPEMPLNRTPAEKLRPPKEAMKDVNALLY